MLYDYCALRCVAAVRFLTAVPLCALCPCALHAVHCCSPCCALVVCAVDASRCVCPLSINLPIVFPAECSPSPMQPPCCVFCAPAICMLCAYAVHANPLPVAGSVQEYTDFLDSEDFQPALC